MEESVTRNQELAHYLHRAVFLIDRTAERALKQQAGLTLSQFLFLLSLDKTAGVPVSQQTIADHLGINKAAISRQVARLRQKGWFVRGPHATSRREYALSLSEEGLSKLRQAQSVMRQTMTPHYRAAGPEVIRSLRAMCESLEKTMERQ